MTGEGAMEAWTVRMERKAPATKGMELFIVVVTIRAEDAFRAINGALCLMRYPEEWKVNQVLKG